MPEGHTLHRLALMHADWFGGRRVAVSSPQGRFVDAEMVDGRVLESTRAVGKHLFHRYEGGLIVHVHLGLYGAFHDRVAEPGEWPPHGPEVVGQVRMRMLGESGDDADGVVIRCLDLRGPTRCEVTGADGERDVVERLGPDPIIPGHTVDRAAERIARSSRPFGALVMDQKIIAGVGNVYRAEVLFRQGIDPFTPGNRTPSGVVRGVWTDLTELMPIGVETGAIHTIRPEHDQGDVPRRGADRPRNYVYQRDGLPCRVCGDEVRVTGVESRSLYWCPTCQVG